MRDDFNHGKPFVTNSHSDYLFKEARVIDSRPCHEGGSSLLG